MTKEAKKKETLSRIFGSAVKRTPRATKKRYRTVEELVAAECSIAVQMEYYRLRALKL